MVDIASTVFSIIGKGIAVVKFIWKTVQSVKQLAKQRSDLQKQLSVLLGILGNLKRSDAFQDYLAHGEIHAALKNLDPILTETCEMCIDLDLEQAIKTLKDFQGEDEKFLRRMYNKVKKAKEVLEIALSADQKMDVLHEFDKRLKLALSILQVAFSYTHAKDLKKLAVELTLADKIVEVYANPDGDPPKNKLESITASVDQQRLVVRWEDKDTESFSAKKYEVSYSETNRLSISSADTRVAIGLQRIRPWQNYAIQVRVVTDTGASPWSFPPVYVRMNEGPPNRPVIDTIDAVDKHCLRITAETPPDEQAVEKVWVEYRLETEMTWHWLRWDRVFSSYSIKKLEHAKEYVIRMRYTNKFSVSTPSGEIPFKISKMIPAEPTDLKISYLTKPSVSFRQANFGAISKYQVQLSGNIWQDIRYDQIVSNEGTIGFPLDVPIDQIKASGLRLQAIAGNGSRMEISGPVSLVKSIKKEETVKHPAIIKFGLDQTFSRSTLFHATEQEPLLIFETIEVAEPKNLTFETLEVPELSVSMKFSESA